MIDFDKGKLISSNYSGAEQKAAVLLDGVKYMLKYSDDVRDTKFNMSYKNNHFAEYIGSHIFEACGFKTHETYLGYHKGIHDKKKMVVGCKDFTQDGANFSEFGNLAKVGMSSTKRRECNIEDVYELIEKLPMIKDKDEIKNMFWDMFVIDALIGNRDRHLGNWGLIETEDDMTFAPIYDCGSSLNALADDFTMTEGLKNDTKFKNDQYNVSSVYRLQGKKTLYHEIFKNPPKDLTSAIKRVVPRINMETIKKIIANTEMLPELNKNYITKAVLLRYELILAPALKRIMKKEKEATQGKSLTNDLKKYKQVADKHNENRG